MIVVVDGAVDLPPELESSAAVRTASGEVWLDEHPFSGGEVDFWARLRAGEHFATTPPSARALADAYSQSDAVIAVHVSAGLSATMARAEEASALVDRSITLVDSRSLSVGAGLIAMRLHESLTAAPSSSVLADQATALPSRLHTFALIQDTMTLRRSGRAGLLPTTHLARGKPLLLALRGRAVALEQVKDRSHAIRKLAGHAMDVTPAGIRAWALGHGQAADVPDISDRLAESLQLRPEFVVSLDPTVGAHLGPDALVVGVLS